MEKLTTTWTRIADCWSRKNSTTLVTRYDGIKFYLLLNIFILNIIWERRNQENQLRVTITRKCDWDNINCMYHSPHLGSRIGNLRPLSPVWRRSRRHDFIARIRLNLIFQSQKKCWLRINLLGLAFLFFSNIRRQLPHLGTTAHVLSLGPQQNFARFPCRQIRSRHSKNILWKGTLNRTYVAGPVQHGKRF